jgi:LacI family transcriptional regulator
MVSIKDIAERANVSIGTVDRVMHNRGRVSDETKARVLRIVEELGYRPNIFARNLSLDRVYHFAVLMPRLSQDSGYWRIPANGIDRAGRELANHRIRLQHFFYDRYSARSFGSAFRQSLAKQPDGLLIAPVLQAAAAAMLTNVPKSIPYVFFDSTIPGLENVSAIGQDSYQSGLLAANLMLTAMHEGGMVAVVRVNPTDFHIDERVRGFLSRIKDSPGLSHRLYDVDSHQGERAFVSVARQILKENKDIGGVFVSNAWTHAIATGIHANAKNRNTCIIGYDLVPKNCRGIESGTISFLISQRPEMQGYEGIYCLYEHVVLREEVKSNITVPIDILTRDNLKYYVD